MLLLVLLMDPVPPAMELPQAPVLLPRVIRVTILLLTESDVLDVLRLVLQFNINQQLVRQLRIVFVLLVLIS